MTEQSSMLPAVVEPVGEPLTGSRFSRASVSPITSPSRRVASPSGSRITNHDPPSPPEVTSERASQQGAEVGLFERDVEFAHEHLLTPHEAVDVAIPPVLAEAAEALATEPLPTVLAKVASSTSISGVLRGHETVELGHTTLNADGFAPLYLPQAGPHQPGWQSPSLTYALEQAERAERAGSPSSSSALDFDSPNQYDRGYTPATSPSPPLLEAKLAAAHVSEPPPSISPLSSAANSPRSLSPGPMVTSMPFPSSGAALLSGPSSPTQQRSLSQSQNERRRLSFMSYADLINIERGNPPAADSSLELGALATALVVDDTTTDGDDEPTIRSRALFNSLRRKSGSQ